MIANVFGPVEGRRHDSRISILCLVYWTSTSNIPSHLMVRPFACKETMHTPIDFTCSALLQKRAALAHNEMAFNQSMSQLGIVVEWVFGDIVNYFNVLDFKKICRWPQCCGQVLHC